MSIENDLIKCIDNVLEFKGVNIELASNFKKEFFNINDEQATDDVRVSVNCVQFDERMLLSVVKDMLANGELTLTFTEKATQRHKEYLDKLSKSNRNSSGEKE